MPTSMIIAFWIVSISLVLVPGADWAYAISAGMKERAIAPAIGGMLLGYTVITIAVAAGVGALVASFPIVLNVMSIVGGAYLLWLGILVLRNPVMPSAGNEESHSATDWVKRGFMVSGMNPKALLLMLALLPQFTNPHASWNVGLQIGALGIVQMMNCAVVYSLVAVTAKVVLKAKPEAAIWVSRFSGVAMITVSIILFVEQM
ncbi:LysE family translocator [Leeia sp. TBRC 13508]|uniref:LysE family translocator n=1 Tax=Leeia speluncae TaxID=2884804 RepID=A0ABS8D8K1_9NEIS|nr:LysE family translocator [Leeia speluncae]MCB6184553.1 LysE family translocator [Leeia speluncae]